MVIELHADVDTFVLGISVCMTYKGQGGQQAALNTGHEN